MALICFLEEIHLGDEQHYGPLQLAAALGELGWPWPGLCFLVLVSGKSGKPRISSLS